MSTNKLRVAFLLSTALVASGMLVGRGSAVTEGADVTQLLDPAYIAAGVCGMGAKKASGLKPVQLAMAGSALAATAAGQAPPLWDNLGDLSHPISTRDDMAQRYFDQGLKLTYAFNHAEALRAFQEAQRLDPDCAMCYWGEAFALGPNINAPMDEAADSPAAVRDRQGAWSAPPRRARRTRR